MLQAYVSSVLDVSEVCFICASGRMLQVCLSRCCMCFSRSLHVFYLDVVYGSNDFQVFFQVSWKHVSSVLTAFRRMLQLSYLDVSKVDQVLYLFSHLLRRLGVSSSRRRQGIHTMLCLGPFESRCRAPPSHVARVAQASHGAHECPSGR
jgi:hypothetical protein